LPDNGYEIDSQVVEFFTSIGKTHNAGVFDAFTPEMRACRSAISLPACRMHMEEAGSSATIGAGVVRCGRLIEDKKEQKSSTRTIMYSEVIREREELSEQIRALKNW
jgi:formate C-acetyltransferase